MKIVSKNKKSNFRILFELNVNHFNNKKTLKIINMDVFGDCFRYATDPDDVNVEDITRHELTKKENQDRLLSHVQIYENGFLEMVGEFYCTAKFEDGKYIRSNWEISNIKTYLLEEEDIQKIA